ncbi:class I tRNA ligase family protein, partial [Candidatus Aerophobetes bacterium]|nr:class I tRNA ligase family protein [Candidatus Aerophobetes bacterium]
VTTCYENFRFHEAVHTLHRFVTRYLSAFYFDVLKDRLYTFLPSSPARRAAQTVLYEILVTLVKLYAPVLCFTAEEVWGYIKQMEKEKEESVFLSSWPSQNPSFIDPELEERWEKIMQVRERVLKEMEKARQAKKISSSLEASLTFYLPSQFFVIFNRLGEEALKEIFIVSQVKVKASQDDTDFKVQVEKAEGGKCERCWNYSTTVGQQRGHPTLCARCRQVVENLA